jgi:hypothetical protein
MAIMVSQMRPKRAVRLAPESGKKNNVHFGRGYPFWTVIILAVLSGDYFVVFA